MSVSSTSSEFRSFPVCEGCLLDFDGDDFKPLLLPCQHAFCKNCLNAQEDNECQNCPTCNKNWKHSNVAKLPVVYDLIPPREEGSARFPVCNICREDFNMNSQRPLNLPCGHCFCQACLEVLRSSVNSSCPQCRGEWVKVDMNRLPIVKSLIHPSNSDKNVPQAPSAAAGHGHAGMSDDEKLRAAETLRLRNSTRTRETKSQIFVTDTKNCTHALQVNLQTDTVTQLRTLVAHVTGIEPQQQRLVYGNQQLEDGRTLAQCRIRENARLVMTCRLRGGLQYLGNVRIAMPAPVGEGLKPIHTGHSWCLQRKRFGFSKRKANRKLPRAKAFPSQSPAVSCVNKLIYSLSGRQAVYCAEQLSRNVAHLSRPRVVPNEF